MTATEYTDKELELTRRAWHLLEAFHDTTYFVKECRTAYKDLGISDVWTRYFAGRAAPMGRVGAGAVIASFYNFSPTMVKAAVPPVWETVDPTTVVKARFTGIEAALGRLIPQHMNSDALAEAAELAMSVARTGRPEGKPIYAANLDLEVPSQPVLKLFLAATLLREHKGDAHNAVLLVNQISGCQAHVLMAAIGHGKKEQIQSFRGWTDQEWDAAADDLSIRGVIDEKGRLTTAGRALRIHIEEATEKIAAELYSSTSFSAAERLIELMSPIVGDLIATGELPTARSVYDELSELG